MKAKDKTMTNKTEKVIKEKSQQTFGYWEQTLSGVPCGWCGTELPARVKSYDHAGGVPIVGKTENQWVYVTCENCKYDWAWHKLLARKAKQI